MVRYHQRTEKGTSGQAECEERGTTMQRPKRKNVQILPAEKGRATMIIDNKEYNEDDVRLYNKKLIDRRDSARCGWMEPTAYVYNLN